MGTVIVDVMLKQETSDPQGQAIAASLPSLGLSQFTDVRQGKHFALRVDGAVTPEVLDAARRLAETKLAGASEEVVSVRAEETAERLPSPASLAGYDWEDDEAPENWGASDQVGGPELKHEARVPAYRRPVSIEMFDSLPGTGAYDDEDDD